MSRCVHVLRFMKITRLFCVVISTRVSKSLQTQYATEITVALYICSVT